MEIKNEWVVIEPKNFIFNNLIEDIKDIIKRQSHFGNYSSRLCNVGYLEKEMRNELCWAV